MSIKALTLWQPWASLVATKKKLIETRSWGTDYRGPLAIHAAKRMPREAKELAQTGMFLRHLGDYHEFCRSRYRVRVRNLSRGCVLAVCRLKDVRVILDGDVAALTAMERAFGDYTPGRYAWFLEDIRRFYPPVSGVQGHQRLWSWDYHLVMQDERWDVVHQVSRTRRICRMLGEDA